MTTHEEFNRHLSHALANLFDFVQLDHNPLYSLLPEEENAGLASPGRALQRAVMHGIDQLKPDSSVAPTALPWRTYHLIRMRYVEGRYIKEIMNTLQLGDRQLRRENQRAVAALASILWERWRIAERGLASGGPQGAPRKPPEAAEVAPTMGETGAPTAHPTERETSLPRFSTTPTVVQLSETFESILSTLKSMPGSNWQNLCVALPADLSPVQSDRVLLRQACITAFHRYLFDGQDRQVTVTASLEGAAVRLVIEGMGDILPWDREEFESLRKMFEQVNNRLRLVDGRAVLDLPVVETRKIMVIDDDDATIHLYRRYLTGLPYTIYATQDSKQATALAEQVHPDLILLDVLLPDVDGWEVLQQLKHNEIVGSAPVIVCSAWNEPDIAISLGASAFLRKNVLREELISAIQSALGLRDRAN